MRNKYTHQHLQQEEQQQQQEHEHHLHHHQRSGFLPMLCSSSSTKQVIKPWASHRRYCSSISSSPSPSPSSSTVSDDPLSPRVGCMGQVKRNNKVVGFPKTTTNTTTGSACINTSIKSHDQISNYTSNTIVSYYKLKRFFSTKSLTSSPTTTFAARNGTHKAQKSLGRNQKHNNNNNNRVIRANGSAFALRDDHGAMISRSKIDENCGGAIVSTNSRKKINNYEKDGQGSFVNLMDLDPPLPVVQQEQKQGNNGEENSSLWKRRSRGAPLKTLQVQTTHHSCNLLIQPTTV